MKTNIRFLATPHKSFYTKSEHTFEDSNSNITSTITNKAVAMAEVSWPEDINGLFSVMANIL